MMQGHSAQATGLSKRLWRQRVMETKSYFNLVFTMAWGKNCFVSEDLRFVTTDVGTQHLPLMSLGCSVYTHEIKTIGGGGGGVVLWCVMM